MGRSRTSRRHASVIFIKHHLVYHHDAFVRSNVRLRTTDPRNIKGGRSAAGDASRYFVPFTSIHVPFFQPRII